ncbi:MAG: carboxypeptidase-like regulatory domain-containing protein [Treponemataceae bacterium]|nr:carboxypeptidase-like regulatory domain-containing protein [Treponemataceae bacterium]
MKNRIWSAGFVAAILLTFSSCMFLGIGSSPSDTGTIEIILGASGRSVVQASQSTTASYLLEITGSGGFKDSRTLSKNAGSYSISLQPGEYTLTITAISADGKESAWDQQSVIVSVGRTFPVAFQLQAGGYQDTKIYLWNQVTGFTLQRFDSAPEDLMVTDGVSAANSAFAEDRDDNWYFFCYGENGLILQCYRNNGTSVDLPVPEDFYPIDDGLYYDPSTDSLWGVCHHSSYVWPHISDAVKQNSIEKKGWQYADPGNDAFENGIATFAAAGNALYYVSEDTLCIAKGSISQDYRISFAEPVYLDEFDALSGIRGRITDLAAIGGKLYVLVCDFTGFAFNNDGHVYSRGCMIELKDTGTTLEFVRSTGWTDTVRHLEEKDAPEGLSISGSTPTKSMYLHGPSRSEASSAFYGPRRFVALKPKELYIVDCGVNITLTDWKGFGDGAKPNIGQVYLHERLTKVDLGDFGLSVVREEVFHDKGSVAGLFTSLGISGAAGYDTSVFVDAAGGVPSHYETVVKIKDPVQCYYAAEESGYFPGYEYYGPFLTEEE